MRSWSYAGTVAVGVILAACALAQAQPTDTPVPQLEISSTMFNFHQTWHRQPAIGDFTVKNTGDAPLTLSLTSACGCAVVSRPQSPLAPGETSEFSIRYDARRLGFANTTVTLTTNDPKHETIRIPVWGEVKPVFALSPADRLTVQWQEPTAHETYTFELENNYGAPLPLKLVQGRRYGSFDVALKPIKPGHSYELTVATKPPLHAGWNKTTIMLNTGLGELPLIEVPIAVNAQPRVYCSPASLIVKSSVNRPTRRTVRVRFRADNPIRITDVKANLDAIGWTTRLAGQPRPGQTQVYHSIRVTLPAYADLPETGAELQIFTDAEEEQYQRLVVPILRGVAPESQATTQQAPRRTKEPARPPTQDDE